MADFKRALDILLTNEGGYVNNVLDTGGATRFGVTEKVAREWGYKGDMRQLPLDLAGKIYEQGYWKPAHCDDLSDTMSIHMLDTAVNCGVKKAIQILQRALKLEDDGIYGPKTHMTMRQMKPEYLVALFCAERILYYTNLNGFSTFGKGWLRRVANTIKVAESD